MPTINVYDLNKNFIASYDAFQDVIAAFNIPSNIILTKCLKGAFYCYKDNIFKYDRKDDIKYPDIKAAYNPVDSYKLYNNEGYEMCHMVGCTKHTDLVSGYNGLFCLKHYDRLVVIRRNLNYCKRTNNRAGELVYRQQEFEFRKKIDPAHVYLISYLEKIV